jgi:hypothetical protein
MYIYIMHTHFIYIFYLTFLSLSSINSQQVSRSETSSKKEGLILSNIVSNSLSGSFWVNYYVYSTDDCSNPVGMIGGTSSDRCEKITDGGSRSMSSCDSTDGVTVIMTYNIYTSDNCLGTVTTTETSTYPAICTNDAPKQGSYRGTCSVNPDYGTQGKKDYVSTTCDGLVTSFISYTANACVSNGDGIYNLLYFDDCLTVTYSSHTAADCGDVGTNITNYPIEAGTCHNNINTDDLLYFDDDINNGYHWNDKGSIKEYCNSSASIFTNVSLFALSVAISATVSAFLIAIIYK